MLKKIRIKNSTILLIGIIIILLGICMCFYEYFVEKKQKAFNEMNILLYENEVPQNIQNSEEAPTPEENVQNNNEENIQVEEPTKNETKYNYIGILEIPKINLRRGFLDLNSKYNNVDYNVTVIKGSTFPNVDKSNLILAAHSGSCWYCYFDDLYKLNIGDSAFVTYDNVKYIYKIVDIYEVKKDGTVGIYRDYSKSGLTLITCTRNNNTSQTVYILDLEGKE